MFQSALLWFCFAFSPIPVWVWFVLSMFPVFLLLSLYSPFQLPKATCVNETTVCVSRNDDDGSTEGVVDSEDSSSSTDEYDVFLSFRGPDTRQGFTDVLYDTMKRAGIRVFRDDDEVSIGQPLRKILHAIETSQICVPIFSRTFASSTWCLREVAKMMELKKAVMPIFYDVKPDDVKLKTEAYRKDLKMHEKKNGKDKVKVWEDALKEVSRIKGKEVLNTGYTEFCKKLVEEGLSKLRPRKRSYDECLVGIDRQIKYVIDLMDIESPHVLYIGIHGMGGIGKTTLAKSLFEKLSDSFDCFWFLGDVRESSLKCNGLQDLQKQLQEGLDSEFSRGCNSLRDIKERFRTKKVLIVLDDVDKLEQIEKLAGHSSWFGSGSRIIVTTRNVDVLKNYGKLDQNKEVQFFEMMTLVHEQALELFQRYAFREEKPPSILETISREIVLTVGGLPLALKVMGSRLYNFKDEQVWREVLERSREVQDRDVMGTLRISYDALEDDQKKIFLDIACVPDMKNKAKAMYMWEASKFYPRLNLAVLSSMSLVKIGYSIMMHDLLRDLGKNIDREARKSTRVCKKDEALNVLLSKVGKENIEILCVDKSLGMSLTNEHFESFHKLRFLKLVGTNLEGDFNNLLPKLVWFTWCYCPPILKVSNLCMKNLVVLNLSHGLFSESWDGWSIIQNLNHLKDLDLSYCHNLTSTPDFSELNHLESLTLSGCSELREIHSSVGKLQRLKDLDLSWCPNLTSTSDFSEFNHLESLTLSGWSELREIHSSVGKLKRLKYLNLSYCRNLTSTPDFSELNHLESLTLSRCSGLREIHSSVGKLQRLKYLDLSHCRNLTSTPDFSELNHLESLTLSGCGELREIHSSVGKLKRLKHLDLSDCHNLTSTPDFSELNHFESLTLSGCSELREIHSSVGKLKRLKYLNLKECYSLDGLPNEIGMLENLEVLTARGSSYQLCKSLITFKLPQTFGYLKSLVALDLIDFEIKDIPDSIRGLVKLKRMSLRISAEVLPESLGDLKSLVALELWVEGISKLSNSLGRLVNLVSLTLTRCRNLEELPSSLGRLVKLKSLELLGCINLKELPSSLGSLVKLDSLELRGCRKLEELPESLGSLQELRSLLLIDANKLRKTPVSIGKLKKLEVFMFTSTNGAMLEELPTELFGPSSMLRRFTLQGSSISTLPSTISQLPHLEELYLEENHQLQELPDLPLSLRNLSVSYMLLQRPPDVSRLVNLSELSVFNMADYRWPQQLPSFKFEGIEKLTILRKLKLGVASAATLSQFNLDSLTQLNDLTIDFQTKSACVSILPSLDLLEDNSQSSMVGLNLRDLSSLKYLTTLTLKNCLIEDERVESLGIQHLGNVTSVVIENCGLKLIEQICLMKNLKHLSIQMCKELVEIPGLENLESLKSLQICNCGLLERLENLSKLEKLSIMELWRCPNLRIVEGADKCSFDYLNILYCRSLQNVEELKKLSKSAMIYG